MKKIKRVSTNLSTPERRFGVILESMDKKIDQVLEGHSVLDNRIGDLDTKVGGLRNEFSEFRTETNSNFASVFEYLSRIDDELKGIKYEIVDLKNLLTSKAEISRLESLEKRVHDMEIKLASYKK